MTIKHTRPKDIWWCWWWWWWGLPTTIMLYFILVEKCRYLDLRYIEFFFLYGRYELRIFNIDVKKSKINIHSYNLETYKIV